MHSPNSDVTLKDIVDKVVSAPIRHPILAHEQGEVVHLIGFLFSCLFVCTGFNTANHNKPILFYSQQEHVQVYCSRTYISTESYRTVFSNTVASPECLSYTKTCHVRFCQCFLGIRKQTSDAALLCSFVTFSQFVLLSSCVVCFPRISITHPSIHPSIGML